MEELNKLQLEYEEACAKLEEEYEEAYAKLNQNFEETAARLIQAALEEIQATYPEAEAKEKTLGLLKSIFHTMVELMDDYGWDDVMAEVAEAERMNSEAQGATEVGGGWIAD